jgi:FdhD protein
MKVTSHPIARFRSSEFSHTTDLVVVEEPLEILLEFDDGAGYRDHRLSVTMRTPGNDEELAAGFVITEDIVPDTSFIRKVSLCNKAENAVKVSLSDGFAVPSKKINRNFFSSSSCGICGKDSLDAVHLHCKAFPKHPLPDAELILSLPAKAIDDQMVFRHTGGLHACSLFDLQGNLLRIREDVGRHNALDKLIGSYILEGLKPPVDSILLLSGRAGFEMIQKAAKAGWGTVCSIGAPSSLALDLAVSLNMNLIGFLRTEGFNLYHQSH